jgi:hypothetical protein
LIIDNAPQLVWTVIDTFAGERACDVSFWAYVDNGNSHVPVPRLKETNPAGQVTYDSGLHRESINWSAAYGSWIEVRFPFTFKGGGHRYELFIDNNGPVIDNLLIQPQADTSVFARAGMLYFNNLPIPDAR